MPFPARKTVGPKSRRHPKASASLRRAVSIALLLLIAAVEPAGAAARLEAPCLRDVVGSDPWLFRTEPLTGFEQGQVLPESPISIALLQDSLIPSDDNQIEIPVPWSTRAFSGCVLVAKDKVSFPRAEAAASHSAMRVKTVVFSPQLPATLTFGLDDYTFKSLICKEGAFASLSRWTFEEIQSAVASIPLLGLDFTQPDSCSSETEATE